MMHDSAPSPVSLISSDDEQKVSAAKSVWRVRFPIFLFALFGIIALLWHFGLNSVFGVIDVSTPDYEVLHKGQGYEIRWYPASTAIASHASAHSSFMSLAGFIGVMGKPQNDRHEKIAMTAPVVTMQSSHGEEMQFILPSNVNGTAPHPTNHGVRLVTRPSSAYGVETFSGSWSTYDVGERAKKLQRQLKSDGYILKEDQPWQLFRYNPPWTISAFRTNEVAVAIEWPPAKKPTAESNAMHVFHA
mmetsp:Transcript_104066/g.164326  ORF Transcript_104066/g.164326 Transcript_104066/m.164326 type:complete len:245 (-) Transcript_104066:106-840(-)